MEFASLAMLSVQRNRSGPVLTPPGEARSPIFAQARLQARNLLRELGFENIFLLLSGRRLMSNSRALNLTK